MYTELVLISIKIMFFIENILIPPVVRLLLKLKILSINLLNIYSKQC